MSNATLQSILFFIVAGLLEIGDGYLMWLWLREKWAWWVSALGAFVIILYGVVPNFQPAGFGRVYAAVTESAGILFGGRTSFFRIKVVLPAPATDVCLNRAVSLLQ